MTNLEWIELSRRSNRRRLIRRRIAGAAFVLAMVVVPSINANASVLPLIDGWAQTPSLPGQIVPAADCFEDEAVVMIVSNFEGGEPFDFEAGEFACAPYDDINAGNRPEDWR